MIFYLTGLFLAVFCLGQFGLCNVRRKVIKLCLLSKSSWDWIMTRFVLCLSGTRGMIKLYLICLVISKFLKTLLGSSCSDSEVSPCRLQVLSLEPPVCSVEHLLLGLSLCSQRTNYNQKLFGKSFDRKQLTVDLINNFHCFSINTH